MDTSRRSHVGDASPSEESAVAQFSLIVTGPTSLVRTASCSNPPPSPLDKRQSTGSQCSNYLTLPADRTMPVISCSHDDGSMDGALSDGEVGRKMRSNKSATVGASSGKRLALRMASKETTLDDSNELNNVRSPSSISSSHTSLRSTASVAVEQTSKSTKKRVGSKLPTRRISCKDLGNGQCQGWLMKKKEPKGLGVSKWSPRWCVLHNKSLYYYKTAEWGLAEGVIYLPGFQVSPAPEVKHKKFAFKVHHPGMTFTFAAERQDDMAKWMNKMALASLGDVKLDLNNTAGFLKPDLRQVKSASHLDLRRTAAETTQSATSYYSESDDSRSGSRTSSTANSSEDITDLYRNIRRADLDLAGSNVKNKRSTILMTEAQRSDSLLSNDEHNKLTRKLLSLKRTLKDKEQRLSLIEQFIQPNTTITTDSLRAFVELHPHIAALSDLSFDLVASSVDSSLRLSTSSDNDSLQTETTSPGS